MKTQTSNNPWLTEILAYCKYNKSLADKAIAHAAYHCGQIVTTAKLIVGDRWETLTVPPGGSAALNASMGFTTKNS